MTGFDPGSVRLTLEQGDSGLIRSSAVVCQRPSLSALFRGQAPAQVVNLVPMLYSLCGKAQGIAAQAALAAARGNPVAAHVDAEAWAEAAREHAWKLLVDWPRQLGLSPDEPFFVRLLRARADERHGLAGELSAYPLLAQLVAAAGHGGEIAKLFVARLGERRRQLEEWLAGHPGTLGLIEADPLGAGTGQARVETARGPLVHRMSVEDDRVTDYVVTAPTDVYFAPGGEVARWLDRLQGLPRAEAEHQARLLVLAFDPCVPWSLG